jgi:hypothetical protein
MTEGWFRCVDQGLTEGPRVGCSSKVGGVSRLIRVPSIEGDKRGVLQVDMRGIQLDGGETSSDEKGSGSLLHFKVGWRFCCTREKERFSLLSGTD